MNCRDFEPLLALEAGGDLAPDGAARLDEHLRHCAACRKLASELASSQAALAALKTDEPDPASLAPWRQSVLNRIAAPAPRPSRFIWAWAGAAAAATAALVLFALLPRTAPLPPPPPPIAAHIAPPARPALHPAPKPHRPRRPRRPHPAPKPKPNYPIEPLLVRLETSDPNVIIYWIAEGKGD